MTHTPSSNDHALATVINCIIVDNTAAFDGGGVFFDTGYGDPPSRVINTLFTRNVAYNNCGAIDANKVEITNCTIAHNEANAPVGYAIGGACTCDATIANSIIWGNVATQQPETAWQLFVTGDTTVRYSDLQAGGNDGVYEDTFGHLTWDEDSNIGHDEEGHNPVFVDAEVGVTGSGPVPLVLTARTTTTSPMTWETWTPTAMSMRSRPKTLGTSCGASTTPAHPTWVTPGPWARPSWTWALMNTARCVWEE